MEKIVKQVPSFRKEELGRYIYRRYAWDKVNPGKGKIWLELARTIVTSAGQASYIAREGSFEEKREFVKKIGSNFRLAGATLLFSFNLPYNFLAQKLKYEKWGP